MPAGIGNWVLARAAKSTVRSALPAAATVRVVEPVIEPEVALMTLEPAPTPVARPEELTVAAAGVEEAQVAVFVKSRVLRSL